MSENPTGQMCYLLVVIKLSERKNMSEDNSGKRNRVNLTIPFSLLEKIDAHVDKKLEDGESRDTANRSAFVMEMFKLGLRVYENKINKDASEKTLDQKLEFIAKNVLVSGFITDAIFGIQKETVDPARVIKNEMVLDPEWVKAVNERVAGKLQEYFK
ncbi:relaxosome protein TraM [Pantoea agglomerans]|uniref:relaxosome protein TraM n=1 Tax=Enterobacter agglomerans TaxID=549 RepID=UPI0013CFDF54|nr:relaxosome protein TraM [Pantoea agglomerans]NEG59709.1 hypothetical protein [Pantoea agglomerans]